MPSVLLLSLSHLAVSIPQGHTDHLTALTPSSLDNRLGWKALKSTSSVGWSLM